MLTKSVETFSEICALYMETLNPMQSTVNACDWCEFDRILKSSPHTKASVRRFAAVFY